MLFVCLLLWKSLWAVLSQTWYVPDETWQSVEVAHKLVWGTGYLTWEWDEAIRSSLHPMVIAILFQILSILHLDYQWLVILLPKLLTASFTALSDLFMYKLVKRKEGTTCAAWFLLLTQTNWFLLYSGSRTIINTVETTLFCLGLSVYPRPVYLGFVAFAGMIRPTVGIAWFALVILHLFSILKNKGLLKIFELIPIPLGTITFIFIMDSIFYGKWTFTPWNFFRINIVHNLGQFYGTHPQFWYFTNALLPILGPLLLPAILSIHKAPQIILLPVLSTLIFFSILPHKEMRFLQPIIPLFLYASARFLSQWTKKPPTSSWLVGMLLSNLPLAIYLTFVHQRGVVDAAIWLGNSKLNSSMFLMPCHSTPLYSHVHSNMSLRILTCEPNLSNVSNYQDEAEEFYSSPGSWLEKSFPPSSPLPESLVTFNKLEEEILPFLTSRGYTLARSFFHSHLAEGRVGEKVLIYCRGFCG